MSVTHSVIKWCKSKFAIILVSLTLILRQAVKNYVIRHNILSLKVVNLSIDYFKLYSTRKRANPLPKYSGL